MSHHCPEEKCCASASNNKPQQCRNAATPLCVKMKMNAVSRVSSQRQFASQFASQFIARQLLSQ
jgi:hypothetical protein